MSSARAFGCAIAFALLFGAMSPVWAQPDEEAFDEAAEPTWAPVELEADATPEGESAANIGTAETVQVPATPAAAKAAPPEDDPVLQELRALYPDAETEGEAENAAAATDAPPVRESLLYQFLNVFLLLLLLCGLLVLVVYALKRFGAKTPMLAGSNLGTPMGRVHLAPRVALHYVRTGGRVLVIGVTQNDIAPVAEFDEAAFDAYLTSGDADADTSSFQAVLGKTTLLDEPEGRPHAGANRGGSAPEDDELAALRTDLDRLRRYLQESPRDSGSD